MPKVAVLIDGGYFLRRLPRVRRNIDSSDPDDVVKAVSQLIRGHLNQINQIYRLPSIFQLLYRSFYYDALPYAGKGHTVINKRSIDFDRSEAASFRRKLFDNLRSQPNLALRLGHVEKPSNNSWVIKPGTQKRLLNGDMRISGLTDSDFVPNFHQKGVDIRIGLDIATITLKRQADTIILVSGDSDFVPAAKLARRDGVTFILDPLWQNVSPELLEHIDGLRSGFYNPQRQPNPETDAQ